MRGNRLGVAAYALRHDAVVGGGHYDGLAADLRALAAEYAGELHGYVLEDAEASGRFGEIALALLSAAHCDGVRGANGV